MSDWKFEDVIKLRKPNRPIQSVLDIGAGLRDGLISSQIAQLECDLLISVEPFLGYHQALFMTNVKAKRHKIVGDPIELYDVPEVDVVYMLDVLEHLSKVDALELLKKLSAKAKYIAIWIPLGDTIGYACDFHNMGNQIYQMHRSEWSAEELSSLGFSVEVFKGFHTHVREVPVDAAWAIWEK